MREGGVGPGTVCVAQVALLSLNIMILVLVCFPALSWAGAIARVPVTSILSAPFFLFFYPLTYGVWGLVTAALSEQSLERRQIVVRCVLVSWFALSAVFYLPLNPVAFFLFQSGPNGLFQFGPAGLFPSGPNGLFQFGPDGPGVSAWLAATMNPLFHFLLLVMGVLTLRQILKRRALPGS